MGVNLNLMQMRMCFFSIIIGLPQLLLAGSCGGPIVQAGWFTTTQKTPEYREIHGFIDDAFHMKSSAHNSLYGIGYYFNGCNLAVINLLYGVNAFYLAPTEVKGFVIQDNSSSTNLAYRYSRTNYPIYVAARALLSCPAPFDIVIDVGIGPNLMRTGKLKEKPLKDASNGIPISDSPLCPKKSLTLFSASAGIGVRMGVPFINLALEINYRCFYLGQARFKMNGPLKNTLHTGNHYAHALFFSLSM